MARPKSDDKRNAILAAAARVSAEQGGSATTARIAKEARVAEGTLFTYFANKDDLLNQLYLDLKSGLRDVMLHGYPLDAPLRERAHHAWNAYVDWGISRPAERRAMEAERETIDRYVAAYLSTRVGELVDTRITGVQPLVAAAPPARRGGPRPPRASPPAP